MSSPNCIREEIISEDVQKRRRRRRRAVAKSSYTVHIDEGLMHLKRMNYRAAKCSFDTALDLRPDGLSCGVTDKYLDPMALICRSQCNMHLGQHSEALGDAERCIEVNSHFQRGLFQFGEVLFSLGFFERALIYYHQGRRLRPNSEEFLSGIAKAENAICTAILDRAATQIEDIEDLIPLIYEIDHEDSFMKHQCCIRAISAETLLENRQPLLPPKNKFRERWVTRDVLGDLAQHKFFAERCLEKLSDKRRQFGTSTKVHDTVDEIIFFLKHQERLMREMKPMYYRYKGLNFNKKIVLQYEQEEIGHRHANRTVMKGAAEGAVLKNIAQIEHALSIGRNQDAQLEAARSMRQIQKMTLKQLPRKFEFILDMVHYRGLAFYRQKKYLEAIEAFKRQIRLAQKLKNDMAMSRALDFMGRSNALQGAFNEAIDSWEIRTDFAKTPLEKTYTNHELGRCNLELGKRELARYYGNESLNWAIEGGNFLWETFARILLGQVELKSDNHQSALDQFSAAQQSVARTVYNKSMSWMLTEMIHRLKFIINRNRETMTENHDPDDEPLVVQRANPPVSAIASEQAFS